MIINFINSNKLKTNADNFYLDLKQNINQSWNQDILSTYKIMISSHWQPGPCRHVGFWYSRGRLIYNLDCDNFSGYRCGREMIDKFEQYGNDDIIYIGFNGVFSDGVLEEYVYQKLNHFKIMIIHIIYQLFGHDDSFLLLSAILELGVKILSPSKKTF